LLTLNNSSQNSCCYNCWRRRQVMCRHVWGPRSSG